MKLNSRSWGLAAAAMAIPGLVLAAGVESSARPPGNNGVIKIDDIPFDQHPDNEPHVGCTFEVDFYNYEMGDYYATVRFTVHPPSGKPQVLLTDSVFIGEDAAGGGTDLDAENEYNLADALKPFWAHPNQGYHVKLKVRAPGSIGKDTKYKTFWVTGCAGY
ncbi:hypothetical protein ACFP3Q_00905 [Nocardioides sp. GCM10027113]|uniref:hypothetical protein n=1 Tax=unclassified Nocardioides TaxID=2615069 RepID=UPI00360D029F